MTDYTAKYNAVSRQLEHKREERTGCERFFGTMFIGTLIATILLLLNGWTILDKNTAHPWLNHGFSIMLALNGGVAMYIVDQIVLSIEIYHLRKQQLKLLSEGFWEKVKSQ